MAGQRGDALPIGYTLERYQIDGILGDGGFGITYIATHTLMQKQVAIKELFPFMFALRAEGSTVIPRGGNDGDAFQKTLVSFLDEAKVLTLFSEHPNIVTVLDFFEANGTAYLVMQYEEGQTLSQWLCNNSTPSEAQLLDIFIPILDGLREIHAQNHLHRDIKPENIYIRSDGRPMLIDFGAARQVIGQQSNNLSVVLTDGYAPNEQYSARGKQGAWTDIYSVGATMWSAISKGEIPLSAPERIDAHINQEPDPLVSASVLGQSRYSSSFLQAIDWALTTVPNGRPQTVQEFQNVLLQKNTGQQRGTNSHFTGARSSRRKDKQNEKEAVAQTYNPTKLTIGILIIALVLIGFGAWWTIVPAIQT